VCITNDSAVFVFDETSDCVHCTCVRVAGGAMNSIGAGAVGGSNGCTVSGGCCR